MKSKKRGQIATEYLMVIGVSFVVLLIYAASLQDNFQDIVGSQEQKLVRDLGLMVQKEVLLASKVEPYYTRYFEIPETLKGFEFTIENSDKQVIIRSTNYDYSAVIPALRGSFQKGTNMIRSLNGLICIGNITCEDTTTPSITFSSPSGTLTVETIALNATTDEEAECKYATEDMDYFSMRDFMEGTAFAHSVSLTFPEGSYTYYIRCKDPAGNDMNTSEVITFDIDLPDGADPLIEVKWPPVNLTTNSTIINATYVVRDESSIQNCTLFVDQNMTAYALAVTKDINQTLVSNMSVGNHFWHVQCIDAAFNEGTSEERNITRS